MTHSIACELQHQQNEAKTISVGNIEIKIENEGETLKPERYNGFQFRYSINVKIAFGKGQFTDYWEVASNNIEEVVEYFRELYRGNNAYEYKGIYVIPYSWE